MSAISILQIKKLIRSISIKDAQKLTKDVLMLRTGHEIEELARQRLKELAPQLIQSDKVDER